MIPLTPETRARLQRIVAVLRMGLCIGDPFQQELIVNAVASAHAIGLEDGARLLARRLGFSEQGDGRRP